VTAGDPLIVALPDTLEGRTDVHYDVLHAPALSWLAGSSFYWRTRRADTGPHTMRFRALYPGRRVAPDTVTLVVKVTAPDSGNG
jgi:hypothetical protein